MSPTFHYFRGFPGRFEKERRDCIRGACGCLGPFIVISSLGAAVSIYFWKSMGESAVGWSAVGLVVLALLFLSSLVAQLNVAWQTSIVPYFEKSPGEIETFGQGHQIARNCEQLDLLAGELGLTPISAFGFNDDLAGETVEWHAADSALATFQALAAAVAQSPQRFLNPNKLQKELSAVVDALQKASEKNIRICLLLRIGDGTNFQEWEVRKGTCF